MAEIHDHSDATGTMNLGDAIRLIPKGCRLGIQFQSDQILRIQIFFHDG
jgi:hypothetical protein